MIGRAIDWFADLLLPMAQKRGWVAAKRRPRNAGDWDRARRASASHSSIENRELSVVQRLARDAQRNNPLVIRANEHLRNRIVGQSVRPQVRLEDEARNEEIEGLWRAWADEPVDSSRHLDWWGLLRLMVLEWLTVGESFATWELDPERGLVVLPFEPEQLADSTVQVKVGEGNLLVKGIEYNPFGTPLQYWILPSRPKSSFGSLILEKPISLPAARVLHAYHRDRASQWRGTPNAAAVIDILNMIMDADLAEADALRAAGYFGLHIKTEDPADEILSGLGAQADDDLKLSIDSKPGGINVGNYDAKLLDSNRPGGNYMPFMQSLQARASARYGVPASIMSGDTSRENYSTMRASEIVARGYYRDWQRAVERQICRRIFREWLKGEVMAGRLKTQAGEIDQIVRRTDWQFPGFEWVDPANEANATEKEINLGLKTWSDACRERGLDAREQMRALSQQSLMAEREGVTVPGQAVSALFQYHQEQGILTINEVRSRLGFDPVAWGDKTVPEYLAQFAGGTAV